ncbi:LOW QUALITY PROTEIN: free fatty acid receptor 3-like [Monodon monoceros]|uniref:LOW QUALITY PROTEIN: free fatty acid receptor 3-like n=1 Tax=Monodon monoceros TaxID=40151 RepID=UPI0010F9CB39|nr:LOW QUALITY PROTEIN: free fatty acid receptor 3-like [Monodon monoceros]
MPTQTVISVPLLLVAMTTNTRSDRSFFLGNHGLHCSMYLFTFLTGLPLKLEALVILVDKLQPCPAAVHVLLLNLTLSPRTPVLFLPFHVVKAASGTRWPLPFIFCPFSRFLFFTTIYLPSLFLAAVSDERFLSVAYPVRYQTRPRPGQAGLVSGACWLLATAHCSVVYVTEFSGRSSPTQGINGTCYLEFRKDQLAFLLPVQLEMAAVLFGVPLLITSYCYSRPVCILADFQGLLGRLTGACGPWWQEGSVTLKSEGEGPPQELSNIQGGSGAGGQVDWPAKQIIPGAVPSSSSCDAFADITLLA